MAWGPTIAEDAYGDAKLERKRQRHDSKQNNSTRLKSTRHSWKSGLTELKKPQSSGN